MVELRMLCRHHPVDLIRSTVCGLIGPLLIVLSGSLDVTSARAGISTKIDRFAFTGKFRFRLPTRPTVRRYKTVRPVIVAARRPTTFMRSATQARPVVSADETLTGLRKEPQTAEATNNAQTINTRQPMVVRASDETATGVRLRSGGRTVRIVARKPSAELRNVSAPLVHQAAVVTTSVVATARRGTTGREVVGRDVGAIIDGDVSKPDAFVGAPRSALGASPAALDRSRDPVSGSDDRAKRLPPLPAQLLRRSGRPRAVSRVRGAGRRNASARPFAASRKKRPTPPVNTTFSGGPKWARGAFSTDR